MKPGHIRVFDGLRITTEHMNHLQAAVHSGLEDLREVAGLGRVHRGLALEIEGEGAVTVQPGIAFDYEANRIACDEPQRAEIAFEPGEDTRYVCVKYQQVEDGQVEGKPTLIWDSCAIELRGALPEPKDNLVPVGRVVRREGRLEALPLEEEQEAPKAATEAPAKPPAPAWRVRQGVLRFSGAGAALKEPRALGEAALPVDFQPASVTTHTLLSARVAPLEKRFENRLAGEATADEATVSQFSSDLAEGSLALLGFGEPVAGLSLALRLERSETGSFKFVCALAWEPLPGEEILRWLEENAALLDWEARVGWKALGITEGQP